MPAKKKTTRRRLTKQELRWRREIRAAHGKTIHAATGMPQQKLLSFLRGNTWLGIFQKPAGRDSSPLCITADPARARKVLDSTINCEMRAIRITHLPVSAVAEYERFYEWVMAPEPFPGEPKAGENEPDSQADRPR